MFAHGDALVEFSRIENERIRIAQQVDLLLAERAQPSVRSRRRKRIRSRLSHLTRIRARLDDEEAELRRRVGGLLRIYPCVHPAGSPASSSRETGVGEHACEVISSEPAGTSTDLSKFEALTLNDTPHVPESADNVEEHAGEMSNSDLGGTNTDLSEFWALILNDDPSYTLVSADRVEVHGGEVRSSEPAVTITGMPEFEALTLNDTPHIPESADRLVVHVDTVESDMLDSTMAQPSALEREKPSPIAEKYWPPKNQGDISFAERQAEKEYAESQAQSLQARGQYTYASKDEILRNANKWMIEEVMVAFRRYIGSEDLKDIEYEFEELLDQCFNVENYFKIFHHFNFTVKIKKCGSTDWTLVTFFAEVISILGTKHYVCYPLEDRKENGHCYACKSQGSHKLRHPSVDIFDCGNEDTTFPYYYEDSDSDDSDPIVGGSESDNDMS